MTDFTKVVIEMIASIPKGKVMTYGGIAAACLKPRASRQVSYILHSMSDKHNLPWHRVINASGKISLKSYMYELQKELLEKEGIVFTKQDTIDLKIYTYTPF